MVWHWHLEICPFLISGIFFTFSTITQNTPTVFLPPHSAHSSCPRVCSRSALGQLGSYKVCDYSCRLILLLNPEHPFKRYFLLLGKWKQMNRYSSTCHLPTLTQCLEHSGYPTNKGIFWKERIEKRKQREGSLRHTEPQAPQGCWGECRAEMWSCLDPRLPSPLSMASQLQTLQKHLKILKDKMKET